VEVIKECFQAKMRLELAKKTHIHKCIQHRIYSKILEDEVWWQSVLNSQACKELHMHYLFEPFGFEGNRLLLDTNFCKFRRTGDFCNH